MLLLQLPLEIRLNIYAQLFGQETVILDAGRQDVGSRARRPRLLSFTTSTTHCQPRSAQILRTCRVVLEEARPMLYAHTMFKTVTDAFAGKIPLEFSTEHLTAPLVRHMCWQIHCDLLKCFKVEDVKISPSDVKNLRSLEICCSAESFKGSYAGGSQDSEVFATGRNWLLAFATLLRQYMSTPNRRACLVEKKAHLPRGTITFLITKSNQREIAVEVSSASIMSVKFADQSRIAL